MRIALVYDAIYPYVKGGAEKRYFEVGKRLSKEHEVHFFGMKYWDGEDVIIKDGMHYHGVCRAVDLYGRDGKRTIYEALYFSWHLYWKLLKADFDVVDCSNFPYFSLFVAKAVCAVKGKKLYGTWHEVWGKDYWVKYLGWKGRLGWMVEKMSSRMPDKIISVSPLTSRRLTEMLHCRQEIVTIPNGIDLEAIRKVKPSAVKSDVIFAGRLLKYKNVDVLLRAIKLATEKQHDFACVIVGDGPERANLEKLSQSLGISKNVRFMGFLESQDDVYALMKSSKVFVLPSSREGFGIVVLEANACGIPVITVDEPENAAKDLIEQGNNGYICKLDVLYAAKMITTVTGYNSTQVTRKTFIDLVNSYDINTLVNEIDEVYRRWQYPSR